MTITDLLQLLYMIGVFYLGDTLLSEGYGLSYTKKHWWAMSPSGAAVSIGWIFCDFWKSFHC